jgi:predicted RNA-binding protein with PUA-like domain
MNTPSPLDHRLAWKDAKGLCYWLMKSEPEEFSFADIKKQKQTDWTGVRNYQARNFMMNSMKKGDLVLFYHSNSEPPGIAGLARVASSSAVPDQLQFDKKSDYFDPKATPEKPIWFCCQIEYHQDLKRYLPLPELREQKKLSPMLLFARGQRLSIQPVQPEHFAEILQL